MSARPPRILLSGASGRLGGFIRAGWRGREDMSFLPQSRSRLTERGLVWDPSTGSDDLVREVAKGGPFDAMVIMAGAVPGSRVAASNAEMARWFLEGARRANVPRVLLASSSAVYGAQPGAPFSETTPCRPTNDYGRDKLAMEQVADEWRDHGLEVCALRIGNVVGADALLGYHRGGEARTLDIYPDGRGPVRSWIDGFTLADAIAELAVASAPLPEAINVACEPPFAMDELADLAGIPWAGRAAQSRAPQSLAMDNSLLAVFSKTVRRAVSAETLVARWKSMRVAL